MVDARKEWKRPGDSVEYQFAVVLGLVDGFRRSRGESEPSGNYMIVLSNYDAVQKEVEGNLDDWRPGTGERAADILVPNLLNQLKGPDDSNDVKVFRSDEYEEAADWIKSLI